MNGWNGEYMHSPVSSRRQPAAVVVDVIMWWQQESVMHRKAGSRTRRSVKDGSSVT